MKTPHLDSETIRCLRNGDLSYEEEEQALDHVVQCLPCRDLVESACAALGGADGDGEVEILVGSSVDMPEIPEAAYSGVLDGVAEEFLRESHALESQRAVAANLVRELDRLTPAQQALMVRNSARFHSWALIESLLDASQGGWSEDPEKSEHQAELALEVAGQLRPEGFRACLLEDLKAEAWSYIANCRRIRSDLYAAQQAFRAAWTCLASGSGDTMARARILDLESSLQRANRDFESAERLLVEALSCYQELEDRHLQGRVLMNVSNLLWMRGEFEQSVAAMKESARLLDFEREPSIFFLLQQNMMLSLLELGRLEEARAMLPEIRELARSHGSRLQRVKLRWTEGLLFSRLGQVELAEETLKQVREAYAAAGIGYNLALVSLDLAALYLEAGDTAHVREIAKETYPLFASRSIHREAIAAWNLFRGAAERDSVTLRLLHEVARRIRRVEGTPVEPGDNT